MSANGSRSIVPIERVESRILRIRGHNVMLDSHLAEIYGTTTKRLNEQVKRNRDRFPEDFMFELTSQEAAALRSHFATSDTGRGGRRYAPYVFTEHGAVMLASVLNTPVAVQASVFVVRAFVRLRQMLATHKELARKIDELDRKVQTHDTAIIQLVRAIKALMQPPQQPKGRVGFPTKRDTDRA